ncbi:uncharacterized protein LACBIDRAFT_308780 [Laccaria bicolor S238N-H82]|uniref:Predicted protein n=1 Tax=Laccaria bicolor (strain S238N-H82 / ATCC MYA-4686) TaxID=486041 RepID=B0CX67_LACBS|nr:uncharacterized protein LACBIDRAFT_308780 [Laccaria bicolor S238N-H82]EDR13199.1 predicted protein [Laccaria bicolor S238N-H82]|eukprot:XP_001875697.1 predicted protein [Laccaria bicolor S238N-H82]
MKVFFISDVDTAPCPPMLTNPGFVFLLASPLARCHSHQLHSLVGAFLGMGHRLDVGDQEIYWFEGVPPILFYISHFSETPQF